MPVGMHHRLPRRLIQLAEIKGQMLWEFGGIERLKLVERYRLISQDLINRVVERVVIQPRREYLLRHQG